MIADATVTVWTPVQADLDHRSWERSVLAGCRLEESRGGRAANPQGAISDSGTLYVFEDAGIAEGDMVADGDVEGAEPPASAMRVSSVAAWTLRGRFHHLEAVLS